MFTPDEAAARWRDIMPFLVGMSKMASERYGPGDLLKLVAAGEYQMWGAADGEQLDAVMLTRLVQYPRAKSCELASVFGKNMKEWLGLLDKLESWAKREGCTCIQPVGRPGWERVLKPHGYEKTHLIFEKRL